MHHIIFGLSVDDSVLYISLSVLSQKNHISFSYMSNIIICVTLKSIVVHIYSTNIQVPEVVRLKFRKI